jgi:rRNA maturation endonuclease Nob1
MDFFEEFGKTIVKLGEATAQKTKEVAEFTKANAKILELQNKLEKAYVAVGKKYVAEHPANEEDAMKDVVEAVYVLEDQITELRKQLQDLKGSFNCQMCGADCPSEATFCSKCGAELKREKVVVDVEEVVTATEEDFEADVEYVEVEDNSL